MADAILEEIWRVRENLIKQHGGLDGYFRYIRKLDRARRQRLAHRKSSISPRNKALVISAREISHREKRGDGRRK